MNTTTTTEYTLCITDGMSRSGGGETKITAASLDEARQRWVDWAQEGDYTSPGGKDVEVEGSIWLDGKCVDEPKTMAPACRAE